MLVVCSKCSISCMRSERVHISKYYVPQNERCTTKRTTFIMFTFNSNLYHNMVFTPQFRPILANFLKILKLCINVDHMISCISFAVIHIFFLSGKSSEIMNHKQIWNDFHQELVYNTQTPLCSYKKISKYPAQSQTYKPQTMSE